MTTTTDKPTHTPGPWALEQTNPAFARFHVGKWAENGNFYGIATDLAGEPDARLIASAPDLLAALRNVVFMADAAPDDSGKLSLRDARATLERIADKARAAIAKAEGGK